MDQAQIIAAVREHALKNYNTNGWDVLVECWEDKDIVEALEGATTVEEAIRTIGDSLKTLHDYGEDIRASGY